MTAHIIHRDILGGRLIDVQSLDSEGNMTVERYFYPDKPVEEVDLNFVVTENGVEYETI